MTISFNLKCVPEKQHYFKIKIFDTRKEMYAYYLRYLSDTKHNKALDFAAVCMPYERWNFKNKKNYRANDIGEVLFYRDKLGAGITAHELGHAAMHWDRQVMKNKNGVYGEEVGAEEERMLDCLYHLVKGFTNQCYKKGVYK